MRIISPFKDYYDSAICHVICDGEEPLWVRKKSEVQLDKIHQLLVFQSYWSLRGPDCFNFNMFFSVIGFCGKLYPLVIQLKDSGKICSYDIKSSTDVIKFYRLSKIIKKNYRGKNKQLREAKSRIDKRITQAREWIFNESKFEKFFDEYQTPVFIVLCHDWQKRALLKINPQLSKYSFFKIFPPAQAYQELEMYYGTQLVSELDPAQITDSEVLRDAKGFDKYSFKHPWRKKR